MPLDSSHLYDDAYVLILPVDFFLLHSFDNQHETEKFVDLSH